MAIKTGDVVITKDCVSNGEGVSEHPALVTKVHSLTEINCVIFVMGDGGGVDLIGERHLRDEGTSPTGKRFIEKGA